MTATVHGQERGAKGRAAVPAVVMAGLGKRVMAAASTRPAAGVIGPEAGGGAPDERAARHAEHVKTGS